MIYVIQTALELGFMYALVAMALFLSYRILDIVPGSAPWSGISSVGQVGRGNANAF